MVRNLKNNLFLKVMCLSLFVAMFALLGVDMQLTATAQAQKSRPKTTTSFTEPTAAQQTIYGDYKGVRIGMSTAETRAILGQPAQRVDDQDFFVITQTETVQIYYDTAQKVAAISIDYMGDNSGAPDYKAVVGSSIETRPDGSLYKMVRYDQQGFWVSYNRSAGTVPIVSITIQKTKWVR